MPGPKLLALDLDGTLLCHRRSTLSMAHERFIKQVKQRNIRVVLVTGRSLLTTAPIHKRLQLDTPLVCFNGSWIGYPDRRCIDQSRLSPQDVRDVITVLIKYPGSISAYPDMYKWVMHQTCPTTEDWADIYQTTIHVDRDAFNDWQEPSLKILYGCDQSLTNHILRELRQRFANRFHIVKSQEDRFEILPHINKATGLQALAEHLRVAPTDIWAVGDAGNDLEMMHWPGKTFAMGHAPLAVRQAADQILPSIEAHGLCALLPVIDHELTH